MRGMLGTVVDVCASANASISPDTPATGIGAMRSVAMGGNGGSVEQWRGPDWGSSDER
jgi:hypothetical protein